MKYCFSINISLILTFVNSKQYHLKASENICYKTNDAADNNLCPQLITFANHLDPDQARENDRPGPRSKPFDSLMIFLKFLKKLILKKSQQATKNRVKLPNIQRVRTYIIKKIFWYFFYLQAKYF